MKPGRPLRRTTRLRPVSLRRRERIAAYTLFRRDVWQRDGGKCALCGAAVPVTDFDLHHRQLRSRRGRDTHSNALTTHHDCHMAVHEYPQWALENGFMVPSWAESIDWPVHLPNDTWAVPDDSSDGEWTVVAPHPDQQASRHPRRTA